MGAQATADVRDARVRLAHGYLQLLANELRVDILHVKGPAIDPLIQGVAERTSFDADILVRPRHVERFTTALNERGWQRFLGFEEGSAFGHAMNLRDEHLGLVDVHRSWPGFEVDPATAFDTLWQSRGAVSIAHVDCAVPDLDAQCLILLSHAARSGSERANDIAACWTRAADDQRARIDALAARLDARLALAAATGHLDDFRDDPKYPLWRYFADGRHGRLAEWSARWRAARSVRDKLHVARAFLVVNPDLLQIEVGGRPTVHEWTHAYRRRMSVAWQDLALMARHRRRR